MQPISISILRARKAISTIRTKHSQFVRCIVGQIGIHGRSDVVDLERANILMMTDTIWKMRVNNPSITYIMRRSQYKPLNTTACRLSPGTASPASGITDVFTGQAPMCPIWVCEAPGFGWIMASVPLLLTAVVGAVRPKGH